MRLTNSNVEGGVTPDEMALVNALLKRLELRGPRNLIRKQYYEADKTVKVLDVDKLPDAALIRTTLGWCTKSVDYLSDMIVNDGPRSTNGDVDSFGVAEWWRDNGLKYQTSGQQRSSLLYGTHFLITTPGDVGEPEVLTTSKNAFGGTGEWSPRRQGLSSFLSITGVTKRGKIEEMVLYLPGETILFLLVDGKWLVDRMLTGLNHVPVELMPFEPSDERPFGYSRVTTSSMTLQDYALRGIVRSEIVFEEHISPIRALLNANPRQFFNPDGTPGPGYWTFMRSKTLILPAHVKKMDKGNGPEDTLIDQKFDTVQGANMDPFIKYIDKAASLFSSNSSIPPYELGVDSSSQPLSEDAITAMNDRLIRTAERTAENSERAYVRSAQTAFMIREGIADRKDLPREMKELTFRYRNPARASLAAQSDAAAKDIQSGLYTLDLPDVARERAGLDAEEIAQIKAHIRRTKAGNYLTALDNN